MTSQEIKTVQVQIREKIGDGIPAHPEIIPLWEIAYQLAVMNERPIRKNLGSPVSMDSNTKVRGCELPASDTSQTKTHRTGLCTCGQPLEIVHCPFTLKNGEYCLACDTCSECCGHEHMRGETPERGKR